MEGTMDKFQTAQNFHAKGQFKEAEAAYRAVLADDPKNIDGLYAFAVLCHQLGRSSEACEYLTRAIKVSPNEAALHHGLASVLSDCGQFNDALSSYRQAVKLHPKSAVFQNDFGVCLAKLGRWEDGRQCFKTATELDAGFAPALNSLGFANMICNDWANAVEAFERALHIDPNLSEARANLAMSYIACKSHDKALKQFALNIDMKRGRAGPLSEQFRYITQPKITHDIEQFRYLDAASNGTDGRFSNLAEIYEGIKNEIDWDANPFKVRLNDDQYHRIEETYNRAFHIIDAPAIAGGALNSNLDTEAITRQYFETGPGVCYFDDMLKPEALRSLWHFLMESTIWFHIEHPEGYVGAYVDDGLACPLLFQIASDLRAAFPEIFGDHQLKQLWAYKYSSSLSGINLHADDAAVNVNFWVSPDAANLDPARGGLKVYFAEAPEDWGNNLYDTSRETAEAIRAHLEKIGENNTMLIPYKENRAGVFNSDLFHETDEFKFKPGYENRRINVTMLFGQRMT
jgi:tetratricopeptide (TPR) repeat protein